MNPTRSPIPRWLCCATIMAVLASVDAQPFVNFEGKQTSPVRLSPDGSRLFAVNTPDNRLSVFDVTSPQNPILIAEIPVGVEPVSVNPRNNDEVWVVNEVSDNISVVSVSQHVVTDTIPAKDEPADVVFANGRAFITAARNNRITVVDVASHNLITNIPVFGENPRALTVNSNGTRVYAAFALSGNHTTIIPATNAPPQPPPTNPNLPPAPQVSLIVDATDPLYTNGANALIKYRMPDNDVVEIDTTSLGITRYFPRVGAVNLAIAVRPNSGDLYVANTDARNLVRFEPVLRGAFITNQISRIDVNSGAVTRYDLNPGFEYVNFPSLRDQTNALAQPTAIAFGPSGGNFFVAAFGSDRIAQVNSDNGAVTARLDLNPSAPGSVANPRTKRGPRGLALKGGQALYVLNRIANTISVVGLPNLRVVREIPTGSYDPTPDVIRSGRGFLYDAKLSGNGTVSCASCHIDAEMDLLAWDLGNPGGNMETNRANVSGLGVPTDFVQHPMKGPMTTQTLKGLNGLDPLHWRGDRTNFLQFNGAFDGLLGGSVLSDTDMRAYRDFVNTIRFSPNPNQNLDRTLPAAFADGNPIAGRLAYLGTNYQGSGPTGLRCNTCHAIPNGTDKSFTPAAALRESQDFKVPQLRSVYQKMRFTNAPNAETLLGFGIVHDGVDPSLFAFLSRQVFGVFAADAVVKRNIGAFVQCFDSGMAPAVGYTHTLTAANVDNANITSDWNLLEAQANLVNNPHLGLAGQALTNIDLVVKGTVNGKFHGFVYQAASGNYKPDTTNLAVMTHAQLRTRILAGDTLTLVGVPTGAGVRSGIDRNGDGILDGDEPAPNLRIAKGTSNAVVAWSTNAAGYVLEQTTNVVPANWTTETSVRGVVAGEFNVTNTITATNRFFRLRGL